MEIEKKNYKLTMIYEIVMVNFYFSQFLFNFKLVQISKQAKKKRFKRLIYFRKYDNVRQKSEQAEQHKYWTGLKIILEIELNDSSENFLREDPL